MDVPTYAVPSTLPETGGTMGSFPAVSGNADQGEPLLVRGYHREKLTATASTFMPMGAVILIAVMLRLHPGAMLEPCRDGTVGTFRMKPIPARFVTALAICVPLDELYRGVSGSCGMLFGLELAVVAVKLYAAVYRVSMVPSSSGPGERASDRPP